MQKLTKSIFTVFVFHSVVLLQKKKKIDLLQRHRHRQKGDKILLPPSAFDTLARLQVDYPMLFKLATMDNKTTHCGVLEFTAEEGCVYIPFWMMQNLLIEEGTLITVTNVSLPKATFVKLQPQSVDFLEISNPRAVLEHALRMYSCVTVHDVIQIPYNNKNYHFELKEVKPSPAACIIETDCNVDFDAPVGYKEPDYKAQQQQQEDDMKSAPQSQRSSACPSPISTAPSDLDGGDNAEAAGIRIVDGKIVRPDEEDMSASTSATGSKVDALLAPQTGRTGVQKNAAIPESAPEVGYWAVEAGDGARLDGKTPAQLKDAAGQTVDIRKMRAEAAARRIAQQQKLQQASISAAGAKVSGTGKTLDGKDVVEDDKTPSATSAAAFASTPGASLVSKRKSRVGSKFSRLKKQTGVPFNGNANSFK